MESDDPRRTTGASRTAITIVALLGSFAVAGIVWWILQVIWPGWPYHWLRAWLPVVLIPYWMAVRAFVSRRYGIDLNERRRRLPRSEVAAEAQVPVLMRQQKGWRRAGRVIFGYVLTPLMLGIALLVGIGMQPYWDAAHGGGSIGQLTLTNASCSDGSCTWDGIFLADDGRYYYSGIEMEDPIRYATVGTIVRVRYEDSLGDAFALEGSRAYLPFAWITAICGAYGIGGLVWLAFRLIHRRRPRSLIDGPIELRV